MASQDISNTTRDTLAVPPCASEPTTPDAPTNMTPPPSTQISPPSPRMTRTPTPPVSHISTPPPTGHLLAPGSNQSGRATPGFTSNWSAQESDNAPAEELKPTITELQAALHEAKMSAAHHQLQYQMLSQESAAAIERMAVEARMAQSENEVMHVAEQARAAATPPQQREEGVIPIQKELYRNMCRQIHLLQDAHQNLEFQNQQQQRIIERQDDEIATLTDRVTLMSERIRQNREQLQKYRRSQLASRPEQTPRSVYATPQRGAREVSHQTQQSQSQPFAVLLQASEMASQESARAGRRGHTRNTHSMSSVPATPQRLQKPNPPLQTPQSRHHALKVPATAPAPRTSAMRTPDIYTHPSLPVSQRSGPASDGTVSAAEDDNNHDSEAETEIIDKDDDEVSESQASRTASQMLRMSEQQHDAKRENFKGRGVLEGAGEKYRQTKLFGAVRKVNVGRSEDEPAAKRARTSPGVGLGISK